MVARNINVVAGTESSPETGLGFNTQPSTGSFPDCVFQGVYSSGLSSKALEIYGVAREFVAPVITDFATYLLDQAQGHQIIFAGRDGLGAFEAAKALKGGSNEDHQLVYAYLTRKIVVSTDTRTLSRYLNEQGVQDLGRRAILADIGMYGSILPFLKKVVPRVEPRFLISETTMVPGYAHEKGREMKSLSHIVGNPAIHFLEDTFSGLVRSPSHLAERFGRLEPVCGKYDSDETLVRRVALQAIIDHATEKNEGCCTKSAAQNIDYLDIFLLNPINFKSLMVPHGN